MNLATVWATTTGNSGALVVFCVYMLGVFAMAALSHRILAKKKFLGEYFLGSRSLGVWAFALTFAATSASGGSFMGFPAIVYGHGWVVALWIGSYMIVPILVMGLLGKRINQLSRKTGAITIPDLLRDRFESAPLGGLATFLLVFFVTINLVGQFKAGSVILQALLHDSASYQNIVGNFAAMIRQTPWLSSQEVAPGYLLCLIVFGVGVIIYTTYGGFRAVVWTDVLQGIVMVGGVVIMLPLAIYFAGGLGNATQSMAEMTPPDHVILHVALNETASPRDDVQSVTIPSGTWLSLENANGHPKRLFRTEKRAEIKRESVKEGDFRAVRSSAKNEDQDRHDIPAIELTARRHIQTMEEDDLSQRLAVTAQVRLHVSLDDAVSESMPDDEFAIRKGTILASTASDSPIRIFQTAEDATFDPTSGRFLADRDAGSANASDVLAIELPSDGDVPPADAYNLPVSFTVEPLDRYAFGDRKQNIYVTGPGPSATSDIGFLPLSLALSFFLMWTFSGAGQPGNMVRQMAFHGSKTLRYGILTLCFYFSLIYFPLVIIFCCARVILPGWEIEPDRIMPEMAKSLTSSAGVPWLAGLLVAAPFAAVMSTVDSFLLMSSSGVVRDIYQRNINPDASERTIKRLTYITTLAIGSAAMIAAIRPPQYLQDLIIFTGSGLSTSFLVPVALSLYWPRFNKAGAFASMLAGFLSYTSLYVGGFALNNFTKMQAIQPGNFHPFIIGAVVSLATAIVVTLMTKPPEVRITRKFFYAEREKGNADLR